MLHKKVKFKYSKIVFILRPYINSRIFRLKMVGSGNMVNEMH